MSQRTRLHVSGGTYFAVQISGGGQRLFEKPADYARFEALLATAVKRSGVRVLGYCWLPDAAHLVVQVQATPLGRFMQGFLSRYARYVHTRRQESGHLFADRYRSLLIEASVWLAPLLRYLHHLPVLHRLVGDPEQYPYSSLHAYVHQRRARWVDVRTAASIISASHPQASYQDAVSLTPTPAEISIFSNFPQNGVLGGEQFRAGLPHIARTHRPTLTLEQIIQDVCILLGVDRTALLSQSRRRDLALARAVIAWHATERRVARLSEVARRLCRHPSTLSVAVHRYRASHAELFTTAALRHFTPLG